MLIVGTGIAGSVAAYESQKNGLNYLLITDQKNPFSNTTSLSNGHCRIPKYGELEKTVSLSVEKFGDNEKTIRFIYENSRIVLDLFEELNIDYEYRAFGIIPTYNVKGGYVMLRKLQENLRSLLIGTKLKDFYNNGENYTIVLRKSNNDFRITADKIILATGGYGGLFRYTDCFRYKDYNIFDMIKSKGANILNKDCLFIHPFGYNNGKRILIGKETSKGTFTTGEDIPIFNEHINYLLRKNDYHEIIEEIAKEIQLVKEKGRKVIFKDDLRKIEINPTVHYTSGGIETNEYGKVKGLEEIYALGECRADGSKKGGRLPGHALTAAIVQGIKLIETIG